MPDHEEVEQPTPGHLQCTSQVNDLTACLHSAVGSEALNSKISERAPCERVCQTHSAEACH